MTRTSRASDILPRSAAARRRLSALVLAAMFVAWALAFRSAGPAVAHGVAWNQLPSDKTITISFIYADQTPMAYSQVKVFSPDDSEIEYQNARTDKSGIFAFRPDRAGEWRFETNDGQGHLAQGAVTVAAQDPAGDASGGAAESPQAPSAPPASGGSPQAGPVRVLLGLSVILNLALLAALRRRRSHHPPKPA